MNEVKQIIAEIKKGVLKPIYFLMGEETYHIDKISDIIASSVLPEGDRGFDQTVLYGRDTTIEDIVSRAKRYPMMAKHQVIIVKEAQELSRTIEKMADYAKNPQLSTLLVFNYKYKIIDRRKALYKALKKSGVVYESKKLYENQIPNWIVQVLASKAYSIDPKAAQLLVEFLGTDLSRLHKALEKLQTTLPEGTRIVPGDIEENIGISKDYNNFELHRAVGEKNVAKAHRIVRYFSENPKEHPMVVTIALLFKFFSQLLCFHGLTDRSPQNVASALSINPYFISGYEVAARNYSMKRVSHIISILRTFDAKSKGVGANAATQADLIKELMVQILL